MANLRKEGEHWFIDASYVKWKNNQLITSSFTVSRQEFFWQILFSSFEVSWVLLAIVSETLLGWGMDLLSKKSAEEGWQSGSFVYLLDFLERKKLKFV